MVVPQVLREAGREERGGSTGEADPVPRGQAALRTDRGETRSPGW